MALRRPTWVAFACAIALTAPAYAHADGTRIYTVAGGGSSTATSGQAATAVALSTPMGVRSTSTGFYLSDATCRPWHVTRAAGSDTGDIGFNIGSSVAPQGACAVPSPPPAIGSGIGAMSPGWTFGNPCCFDDWIAGPLFASSDAGRVETIDGSGRMFRVAGNTPATGCGTASPPALPADGTDATTVNFCRITALDSKPSSNDFILAEAHRQDDSVSGTHKGDLWSVTGNAVLPDPIGFTVTHVTGAWRIAEARIGPYGGTYIADGYALVIAGTSTVWAGDYDGTFHIETPGFSGDGGAATNARLDGPRGITFDYGGRLVIADTNNCRIRALDTNDNGAHIHTLAGRDCEGTPPADLGDGGLASNAYIGHPQQIDMYAGGLLIADKDDNRIRLIDRTSVVTGPSSTTADATPDFTFASLDFSPRFKCKLDGVDIGACDSPFTLPAGTADGEHTLAVWDDGHDAESSEVYWAAPPDPTPATRAFTIDTTAPNAFALQGPSGGATESGTSPTFSWQAATDATSSIDHYELWIDKTKNRDVPTSACLGDTCSAQPAAPLSEAVHKWQVRAVDAVGNTQASEERDLTIGSDPVAAFAISPNPALVERTVTFDGSASSDSSGIVRYEWDLDGDGAFETDGGATPTTTRSYAAPASVAITLRVTDATGKQSTATQTLKVTQPGSAASLLGISINSGAQFTNTPNVKLLVKPPTTASSIVVSNDGGFLVPATFPAAASIDWKLDSSGPERLPKTVYARFMLGPIISETYTDDIILDEIPPVVQSAALAPSGPSRAASAARAKTYVVKVRAKDSNSGVAKVQVTANKKKPGKLLAYKSKIAVKSPKRPKYVRAQDRAGNFSGWKKLR